MPLSALLSLKLVPITPLLSRLSLPLLVERQTLYELTAVPPLEAGALQLKATLPLPATATRFCGAVGTVGAGVGVAEASPATATRFCAAPGTVAGVAEASFDSKPEPTLLTALTL